MVKRIVLLCLLCCIITGVIVTEVVQVSSGLQVPLLVLLRQQYQQQVYQCSFVLRVLWNYYYYTIISYDILLSFYMDSSTSIFEQNNTILQHIIKDSVTINTHINTNTNTNTNATNSSRTSKNDSDNYINNNNDNNTGINLILGKYYVPDSNNCPCDDKEYCIPVIYNKKYAISNDTGGELYGFYSGDNTVNFNPNNINFTYVTTIAWGNTNNQLTCIAHEHSVRVVNSAPPINNLTELAYNKTLFQLYIDSAIQSVLSSYRDGIVFDYELPMLNSIEASTYVRLINVTRTTLKLIHPNYQISTCIAWSPDGIDDRNYLWKQLESINDLLYVMVYDVQSQIYTSQCIASANSPYGAMIHGIERYINYIDISPSKLVLGIPWYGYQYPCTNLLNNTYCQLQYKPFLNVNCSDAIGYEYDYSQLLQILYNTSNDTTNTITGPYWDDNTQSPYFNQIITVTNNNTSQQQLYYQYWYDNPISLQLKYKWAKQKQLLGIGPYSFNFVYPNTLTATGTSTIINTTAASIDMWSSFDSFFL